MQEQIIDKEVQGNIDSINRKACEIADYICLLRWDNREKIYLTIPEDWSYDIWKKRFEEYLIKNKKGNYKKCLTQDTVMKLLRERQIIFYKSQLKDFIKE